jgi:hypothetical protein
MATPDPIDPTRIPDMSLDGPDKPAPPAPNGPTEAIQKLAPWDAKQGNPSSPLQWKPGDAVWAPWEPTFAYPGTIIESAGEKKQVLIAYSDDGRGWVYISQVQPLKLEPGLKVQCRRSRGVFFFPATILEASGDRVCVRFDDNEDEEWTVIAALRLAIEETQAAEMVDFGRGMASFKNLRPGDRVWAPWEAHVVYPGVVVRMQGKRAFVRYDDGCEGWVMREQLMPFDLPIGLHVLSKSHRENGYLPGVVQEVERDRVLIKFHHGRGEWVTTADIAFPTTPAGPDAQPTKVAGQSSIPAWLWWSVPIALVMILLFSCFNCSGR